MQIPTTKQGLYKRGLGFQNLTLPKHLEINHFARVRLLHHRYSITNHSESILKSKIIGIFMIIFCCCFFLSDLLRNILKCNCSPYSTFMTMYLIYLVQYYAAMHFNHSSMRILHLVNGHVVYVYWIDTVYVQNNLPTEFSKRTIFII